MGQSKDETNGVVTWPKLIAVFGGIVTALLTITLTIVWSLLEQYEARMDQWKMEHVGRAHEGAETVIEHNTDVARLDKRIDKIEAIQQQILLGGKK